MNCRICSQALTDEKFVVSEQMFRTGESFIYRRCSSCHCVQIAEYPSEPGQYYPDHYYSFGRWANPRSLKEQAKHLRNLGIWHRRNIAGILLALALPNHFLRVLRGLNGINPQTEILDVGCGYGEQLLALRRLGFENLMGIDPYNKNDLHYPGGLSIWKKHYTEVEHQFGLIMMHHVLEHLPNQHAFFNWATNHLKVGGYLLIRLPLADSLAFETYGTHWVQWDAPRHWYLHTRKSLRHLGQAHGLEMQSVHCDSNGMQFWGSELYKRGIPLFDSKGRPTPVLRYFSPLRLLWYNRYAQYLNRKGRSDQAIVVFQKLS